MTEAAAENLKRRGWPKLIEQERHALNLRHFADSSLRDYLEGAQSVGGVPEGIAAFRAIGLEDMAENMARLQSKYLQHLADLRTAEADGDRARFESLGVELDGLLEPFSRHFAEIHVNERIVSAMELHLSRTYPFEESPS